MNKKLLFLTEAAMIAAIYVVLAYVFKPIGSGAIQVRIAEALTILPFFTPAAIPGLFVGCLLANTLVGSALLDIIGGSIATLIAAIISYLLRKCKYKIAVAIPPILANAIIVPWVIKIAYGSEFTIPFLMLTVGIGEILSCGVLGYLLLKSLENYKNVIFRSNFTK